MAARRRSSASRQRTSAAAPSASSKAPSPGRASRAPRKTSRDGKMAIQCPQCGSEYRIPEDMGDSKVQCKNCPRAFFPNAASSKGARKQQNAQTPMIIGGVIALCLIVLVFALSGGDSEVIVTPPRKAEPTVEMGEANPRVAGVLNFARAIGAKDSYNLAAHSDYKALGTLLKISGDPSTDKAVEDQIVAALFEGDETQWFRLFEITSALVDSKAMAKADSGTVTLYMSAIDPMHPRFRGTMDMSVQWTMANGKSKVRNWTITKQPKKITPRGKTHKAHKEIGRAKEVEKTFGGQKIRVREAELTPLSHLKGTSPELQKEIDTLITTLIDIHGPGTNLMRSTRRLKDIGKPSIPRLLNKMYEIKMDNRDNVLRVKCLTKALSTITGERFGFNPAESLDKNSGATDEWRISTLKQWYGWWADNYDGDYQRGIDQSEDLLSGLDGDDEEEFAEEKKKPTKKK